MRSPLRFVAASSRSETIAAAAAVWILIAASPVFAVDPAQPFSSYVVRHFTPDDGLPVSVVDHILQTPDGFLWMIANTNSLVRFDGRQFHVFDGIVVISLAVGPNGDLWVGTTTDLRRVPSDALNRFDLSGAVSYRAGPVPGNAIQSLHFSRDGVLWVGTRLGLFRFDDGRLLPVGPKVTIGGIEESENGHLFLVTAEGVMEWDGSHVVPVRELEAQVGTTHDLIFHAMEDSHGNVWYSSSQGVARRSGSQWLKLPPYGPAGHGAFRTYEDAQGNVWVAKTEGLFRAKAASLELVIPKMEVRSVFGDRDGNLWVGTNGDGLYRFRDAAIRMFTTADGLPNDVIMTVLAAHDGSIWTGANCGGLTRFDGAHFRTYSEKDGLLNSCVWALAEDANHDLWIGTWGGGAFRFHEGRFTQVLAGEVVSIVAARDGSMWFGTHKGVARLKDGRVRNYTKADGLSKDTTLKVFEDREGRILASNWGGIDRFVGDRFENFSQVPKTLALPMGEDRSGGLFVLLEGKPAALRIEGDRVDTVPELFQNRSLIETDSGELWFGSVEAPLIHRFPRGSFARTRPPDEPLDEERFGALDGLKAELSGGDPDVALGHDGTIWIATPRGLAMCDPHRLPGRVDSPMIYMTEVTVGRETLPAPRELRLQPGTSHVEVGFGAVEITSPEKIRMQFRLDGVDTEWLDAGPNLRAIYSNIPAGSHALRIRACNRGGTWDRAGIAYVIQQQPHFYQTAWFVVLCVLASVAVLSLLFLLRLKQATLRVRTQLEARLGERERIARELHDTLLQSVQGLLLKLQSMANRMPGGDPTRLAIESTLDDADRVVAEGRDRVRDLRGGPLPFQDLRAAFRRVAEEAPGASADLSVTVEGDARDLHPMVLEESYAIGREALTNALVHSGGEHVAIEIGYAPARFRLRVRDDGRGIDPAIVGKGGKDHHWGLQGMRERARKIGAQFDLRSRPGDGTEIELSVPAKMAYRRPSGGST